MIIAEIIVIASGDVCESDAASVARGDLSRLRPRFRRGRYRFGVELARAPVDVARLVCGPRPLPDLRLLHERWPAGSSCHCCATSMQVRDGPRRDADIGRGRPWGGLAPAPNATQMA